MIKEFQYFKKSGEKEFFEDPGFLYEDFIVGNTYKHWPGRTISEYDNIFGSLMSCNQHPLHINKEYGEKTEFKRNLVNSVIVFSIINGMTVSALSSKCIANLGWDKVRLINPVFAGDTIYSVSKILNKRLSKSRRNQGIITIETKGLNQKDVEVIIFERSFLVPCKDVNNE